MSSQSEGRAPIVVVADDEPSILEALGEYLTAREYSVRACPDGESALQAILEETPDLIILDVSMPRISGLEVAHRVRFLYGLASVPILVITGRDDLATRRQSFRNGADAFISKPFDLATFGSKVTELLEGERRGWLRYESRYIPRDEAVPRGPGVDVNKLASAMFNAHCDLLGAMAASADERGPHGPYHSLQVAELSFLIACALHLDEQRCRQIRTAGLYHDVALALLPDEIYRKPGPLDEAQLKRVREHPVLAARVLAVGPFAGPTARSVLHHHERWDGGGYPDGLREKEIPIGARIVAVADAFAAMTTRSLYAAPTAISDAGGELERQAGTQFDPEVVDIFRRVAGC